jgi:hypothetical protein
MVSKTFLLSLFCLLVAIQAIHSHIEVQSVPDDAKLSFKELCVKYGYPFEEYEATTDDGYILTLFRILGGTGTKGPFP